MRPPAANFPTDGQMNKTAPPDRQIRAVFDETTVRVYQAYRDEIADTALAAGRFVSPPFSMTRMTWIKPSFLWMMYRCGWAEKDAGQARVLAVVITRDGFEWALRHACLSHMTDDFASQDEWRTLKDASPVRVQWDPERDFHLQPLGHRSLQVGLSGEASRRYVRDWIVRIEEITGLAHEVRKAVEARDLARAQALSPVERPYEIAGLPAARIGLPARAS